MPDSAFAMPAVPGLRIGRNHDVASMSDAVGLADGAPVFAARGDVVTALAAPGANRVFVGVKVFRDLVEPSSGQCIPVVKRGPLWVRVEAAVQATDWAYITSAGKFGATGTRINARYLTSADANGLAELELLGGGPVFAEEG